MNNFCRLFFSLLLVSSFSHAVYAQKTELQSKLEAKVFQYFYTDYDSTIYYADQTIAHLKDSSKIGDIISLQFYKIICASNFFKFKQQKTFLTEAEDFFQTVKSELNSPDLERETKINLNIYNGNYYYKLGQFNKAAQYFGEVPAALKDKPSISFREHGYLTSSFIYLGTINKKQGNYQQAIDNFLRAQANDNECFATHKKYTNTVILNKHLAESYQFIGDYQNAELYYKKMVNKNLKEKGVNSQINSYNAFAKFYIEKTRFDSALYYLSESLNLQKEGDPFIAETYQLIGEAHRENQNQATAQQFFEKAQQAITSLYGKQHYKVAQINNEYGRSFEAENNFTKANQYYTSALENLLPGYTINKKNVVPPIKALYAPKELLEVMANKMSVLFKMNDPNTLKKAHQYAVRSMDVIDSLRLDYDSESSRQFLLNKSYPIFEQGIAICFKLYQETKEQQYLDEAFRMAEKSKAVLLLDAIKSSNAESFAGIPPELLETGFQLRLNIKTLEDKLEKNKKKKKEEKQLSPIRVQLFEARQAYKDYIAKLEQSHPRYYQLKYDLKTVDVDEVKKELLPTAQSSLIEYFIGDQAIYRFIISKNAVEFDQIKTDFPLKEWVSEFRRGITGNHPSDAPIFTKNAYRLYERLLSGTELTKQLVIIPDGILGYVPFDALLTTPVPKEKARAFSEHPYLLREHNISYSFSATLLKEMSGSESKADKSFLGFAPSFSSYSPLEISKEVTVQLAANYKGDYWENQQASKARFIKEAGNYNILHISSHAVANDSLKDACFLVCAQAENQEDYLLYNRDLYQLDLNASLVVLGACETGSGKLQRGEGILSLARGFSYAGASSLLTTLWSVDEASTARLLQNFYKHLQSGNTTNDALYVAKKAYLQEADNEKAAHPRYWAALIAIGDMKAVNAGGLATYWWIALGAGLLLSVLLIGYLKSILSS